MMCPSSPVTGTQRHRWIVVADSPFLPANGGGELEHVGFLRAATRRGLVAALIVPTDVDPGSVGRDDDLPAIRALVKPAITVFPPRNRRLTAAFLPWRPYVVGSRRPYRGLTLDLRAQVPDATGVVVFSYKSHHLGGTIARDLGLPLIVRMHNMEGSYHRALARSTGGVRGMAMGVEAARIELDERALERARWVGGIADISQRDAHVRAARARVPVTYVPSFAFGAMPIALAEARDQPTSPNVVFLGALNVQTNHDAIVWFLERIWPSIRASVPHAVWRVVGRTPPTWLRDRLSATPGVELHADVPETASYLRDASVAVNPAVSGSGVNIKLVEYLAAGVPVVSTGLGVQGLGMDAGRHAEVADTPAAFAGSVVRLLEDPQGAHDLGQRGQRYAQDVLNVERGLDAMIDLMQQARLRSR